MPVSDKSSGLGAIFNTFSDIAIRGGIAALGVVLIAIGGFAAVRGEGINETAVRLAGKAA